MKKNKILATFGPSVASPTKISQLVRAGVNIFRINCSHGTTEDFLKAANVIREGAKKANHFPVGLLFDIAGPKLRLERFRGELPVKSGHKMTLTNGKTDLKRRLLGVNNPVIALTPNEKVMTRLSLYRSVYPVLITQPRSFSDMLATVNSVSRQFKLARRGDRVVITGGAPFGSTVSTNSMMIHEVGR